MYWTAVNVFLFRFVPTLFIIPVASCFSLVFGTAMSLYNSGRVKYLVKLFEKGEQIDKKHGENCLCTYCGPYVVK